MIRRSQAKDTRVTGRNNKISFLRREYGARMRETIPTKASMTVADNLYLSWIIGNALAVKIIVVTPEMANSCIGIPTRVRVGLNTAKAI